MSKQAGMWARSLRARRGFQYALGMWAGLFFLCVPFLVQASEASRPRVVVLTDIGNEPDDAQSLVRLLLYANDFDIQGLVASTSTWLRNEVHRDLIEERVDAYESVLGNLRAHDPRYPDAQALRSVIRSGRAAYGLQGVGDGKDTEASRLIIDAVDDPDPRPVWVLVWGGATDLAQALRSVRQTRSGAELARFVSRLRVYSISDQDDAGPWIRATFPELFWVGSVHGFGRYGLATWIGISAPTPGADEQVVSREWLRQNIQSKGPLGALYPDVMYIMEGDSGSLLYLIPTGMNDPERPDWGSWGGRYEQPGSQFGLWSDTQDQMPGATGFPLAGNKATIARWRPAFQADFAARMAWSIASRREDANHPPVLALNGDSSSEPVHIDACPKRPVRLSASGSSDPDGNGLSYRWWHYREASGGVNPPVAELLQTEGVQSEVVLPEAGKPAPNVDIPASNVFHIILEAKDDGTPALTRYRRGVIDVPTKGTPRYETLGCGR